MSNPNKHKPLSAEELFKLLDGTNKASDFDELDDFEKDAFEGFSAHADSDKAKTLTEELNLAISKKVSTLERNEGKKSKVIWFSAAASIILIIMISVFFFNQTKKELKNNIVLNEHTDDKAPIISPAGTVPPLEVISETLTNNSATAGKTRENQVKLIQDSESTKKEAGNFSTLSNGPTLGGLENKPAIMSMDEVKNRNADDYDAVEKQNEVFGDKMVAKDKSKNRDQEQEKMADDVSFSSQGVATNSNSEKASATSISTKDLKQQDYKSVEEKGAKAKKSPERQNAAKEQPKSENESYNRVGDMSPASPVQQTKTDDSNSGTLTGSSANSSAYYLGSELAIKEVVIAYFKNNLLASPIGKYKVKGIVDANGLLKVVSVEKISTEDCQCTEDLKKALNKMKKWNAGIKDGKNVSSNVQFVLAF